MRSLLLRSVVLLIALIAAFALDIFRPQTDYSLSNIAYDSATIAPLHIQTPLDAAARFRLQFSVLVDAATDNDILQTSGPDGPSLRFVASPPHRLFFIPFGLDVAPVSLSTTFSLGQWHQITIEGQDNEHFDVALDGVVSHFTTSAFHQVQSSAEVGSKDFRFHFRQIDIGSGTTAVETLAGKDCEIFLRKSISAAAGDAAGRFCRRLHYYRGALGILAAALFCSPPGNNGPRYGRFWCFREHHVIRFSDQCARSV